MTVYPAGTAVHDARGAGRERGFQHMTRSIDVDACVGSVRLSGFTVCGRDVVDDLAALDGETHSRRIREIARPHLDPRFTKVIRPRCARWTDERRH